MRPQLRQVNDLQPEIEAFIESHKAEIHKRYNQLLPEIKEANGQGITSLHNRRFGSKGLYFGPAIQYLYRQKNGQPLPEEAPIEAVPSSTTQSSNASIEDITTPANQAAIQTSQPAPDNDISDFITRHAS